MTPRPATLRVLISGVPDAADSLPWALVDSAGQVLDRGESTAARWPAAPSREAVIAASAVRVMSVSLPPLPPSRLAAAVGYALEERIATSLDEVVVAHGAPTTNGSVVAVVVARPLAAALARYQPPFARALAESELATPGSAWRWCERPGAAFVRMPDGGALTLPATGGDALPAELTLALAQATRSGSPPAAVMVERPSDAESRDRWQRETGIAFRAGLQWHWDASPEPTGRTAIDILPAARAQPHPGADGPRSQWQAALTLTLAAITLHLLATLGTWAWQRLSIDRAQAALSPIARELGLAEGPPQALASAIAALHANERHRAGLQASTDALPTLARAAPALSALPQGALRTAQWGGGAWTFELGALDESGERRFQARLAEQGLGALLARTANGLRARVEP